MFFYIDYHNFIIKNIIMLYLRKQDMIGKDIFVFIDYFESG